MAELEDTKEQHDRALYNALTNGDENEVIKLCKGIPEGPLYVMTIHNDTVLHMATYSKQSDLVLNLLKQLPETGHLSKLTHKNDAGNTILHEAATASRTLPAARAILKKDRELLRLQNDYGETPLFQAARYGKKKMFKFLADEVDKEWSTEKDPKVYFQRKDEATTILHISILAEHFDVAELIARRYGFLINQRDDDGMTPLQLLACNSSAFRSGREYGFLHRLFFSCVSSFKEEEEEDKTMEGNQEGPQRRVCQPIPYIPDFVQSCWRLPLLEAISKENTRLESAMTLSRFLIRKDTSWKLTDPRKDQGKPKTHKYGPSSKPFSNKKELGHDNGPISDKGETSQRCSLETHKSSFSEDTCPEDEEKAEAAAAASPENKRYITMMRTGETPLFLATMSGIIEIVEEILKVYPQAIEHVNKRGRNILHVAIKYRQIEIFEVVVKKEMLARRLIRMTDNVGNSILHMVGKKKRTGYAVEKIQSPALQLQKELILFERVKEISTTYFTKHLNQKKLTAEELFAKTYDHLHKTATEWLKRTSENCIIVAVLISTVAFAAAYTIPGGPNQSTGFPILLYEPFFVVFTLTDALSLTFAFTSVVTFLSILTSSFRLQDFKHSLPQKLMLGFTFLILSVSMMMVAFGATIVLMIRNKERWTKIVLYSVAFLPVTIFVVSYSPMYLSLLETCIYPLKFLSKACPRCDCIFLRSWITKKLQKHSDVEAQSSSIKPQKSHSKCSSLV